MTPDIHKQTKSLMLKAGEYYIGDPCYLFQEEDAAQWTAFLDAWKSENDGSYEDMPDVLMSFEGFECFVQFTAYGDGIFMLESSEFDLGKLYVDAGIIGCLPAELVERQKKEHGGKTWCLLRHTFEEDFEVGQDEGEYRFGDLRVNTSDSPLANVEMG